MDLLALGRIGAPQGRVLGPQAARRIVLLQLRDLCVDRRLQAAQAVPLARPLARADVLRRFGQRREQALEGLGEGLNSFNLQLMGDLVEADPRLGQLLELTPCKVDVFVQGAPHLSVLAERGQRLWRNRVDCVRADELFHVVRVGIARVLGRGARPQRALRASPGLLQSIPARPAEEVSETLIRHLRVGDRGLAVEALERLLFFRIGGGVDLLGQGLVDLRVHAADEKARHAGDLRQVSPLAVQRLEAGQVRVDHLGVAVDREDQRHVDVVALRDLVPDRGHAFLRGGDLDHHIRPAAPLAQVLCPLDGLARVVGDRRRDLDANESVLALRSVVDRPERVGGGLDVLDHQPPQHLGRLLPGPHQLDHRLVVVGRAADGFFEDGRVGGDPGQAFIAQAPELTRADQLAADVVQPQ